MKEGRKAGKMGERNEEGSEGRMKERNGGKIEGTKVRRKERFKDRRKEG